MSDATEAWEEWIEKNRGRPEIWSAVSTDSFAAGFAAGQVAALEDAATAAASDPRPNQHMEESQAWSTWLRARAAELSKETP